MAKIMKPFNVQTHLGCNNCYNRFLMFDVERLNRKYYLITLSSHSRLEVIPAQPFVQRKIFCFYLLFLYCQYY